jgi:hypothetical protein
VKAYVCRRHDVGKATRWQATLRVRDVEGAKQSHGVGPERSGGSARTS